MNQKLVLWDRGWWMVWSLDDFLVAWLSWTTITKLKEHPHVEAKLKGRLLRDQEGKGKRPARNFWDTYNSTKQPDWPDNIIMVLLKQNCIIGDIKSLLMRMAILRTGTYRERDISREKSPQGARSQAQGAVEPQLHHSFPQLPKRSGLTLSVLQSSCLCGRGLPRCGPLLLQRPVRGPPSTGC